MFSLHPQGSHVWISNFEVENFEHFSFLFSIKMLVIRAGTQKMLARIANREDPNQTASSETV